MKNTSMGPKNLFNLEFELKEFSCEGLLYDNYYGFSNFEKERHIDRFFFVVIDLSSFVWF